jgi:hypothetical protein
MGEDPGPVYLVMCGTTRVELAEVSSEFVAVDVALNHDVVHHCSPWIQYPLEHVHRPDDEGVTR